MNDIDKLKVSNIKNSCLKCGGVTPNEHEGKCRNPFLVSDLIKENENLRSVLKDLESVLDKHGQI